MQLRYVFSELRQSLRRNLSMHIAVILTLFVSLTLVGFGILMREQSVKATDQWGSELQITVFLCKARDDNPACTGEVTDTQKQAISKVDYVKLNQACSRKGLAIQLTSARLDGPDRAVVIAKQLVAAQSYTMVYETAAWKLEPAKEGLALYQQGAVKAIAAQKKAGTCANR